MTLGPVLSRAGEEPGGLLLLWCCEECVFGEGAGRVAC